jgi:hypothetical protein
MIGLLLVYDADRLISTLRTKKTGIDKNHPFINYFDVDLDKKYLSMDIFYPKSTEKV